VRSLVRAALLVAVGALAGVLATARRGAVADTPWLGRTGEEWKAMTPDARRQWMEGFLSGSAAANALAGAPADSAALVTSVARLQRDGQFRFPFAPPVYAARLDDYFQWDNHRRQPIWYGIWVVDGELAKGTSRPSR
jgi:hypothetical protein